MAEGMRVGHLGRSEPGHSGSDAGDDIIAEFEAREAERMAKLEAVREAERSLMEDPISPSDGGWTVLWRMPQDVRWVDLVRYPETYAGELLYFTGKVSGDFKSPTWATVDVELRGGQWDSFVVVPAEFHDGSRLVTGDRIRMFGMYTGEFGWLGDPVVKTVIVVDRAEPAPEYELLMEGIARMNGLMPAPEYECPESNEWCK